MRYSRALAAVLLSVFLFSMAVAQDVKAAAKPKEAGRWALLIGVDDYTELGKLHFAGNDQRALAEQLVAVGFPKDQVLVLHDKAEENRYRPFRENIERQLQLILGMADRGDLVLVGFSGHGLQLDDKSYLCPLDTRLEKLEATSIALDSIYNRLAKSRATLKLLLVDACRNDMLPAGRRSVALARTIGEFAGVKERPPEGIVLLASCGPSQVSMEDAEFKHGVFMHYVLEGLRGQAANSDGAVTLAGLYDFASLQTKKYVTRKFNESQTPALRGEINGPFEICKKCSPPLAIAPFDTVVARSHQEAWAKYLKMPVETTNSIGMKLVLIPAGEFMMGSPRSETIGNERPQHRVRITKPFCMGVYEVTQEEYEQVTGNNPSSFASSGDNKENKDKVSGQDTRRFPVENVSWEDAVEFCRRLSQKEGKKYRLPTEAEWEYTCRAGTITPFSFGSLVNSREANFHGTEGNGPFLYRTTMVGSYRPNAFGLYDMHGNVWEWCADWHDQSYYAVSPTDDPPGPTSGSYHVYRGGGYWHNASDCRSANRHNYMGGHHFGSAQGFRVSLVVAE